MTLVERISARYDLHQILNDRPAIFIEPFKPLIFVHEELKRELQNLPINTERAWSRNSETPELPDSGDERPGLVSSEENKDNPQPLRAESKSPSPGMVEAKRAYPSPAQRRGPDVGSTTQRG